MAWLGTLASCGMALGPPLVYLDQYMSIRRTRRSQGFSHVICLVLLTANITRLFYWLGERFDTALLVQSVLMIIAQVALLQVCCKYRTTEAEIGPPSPTDQFNDRSDSSAEPQTPGLPSSPLLPSDAQAEQTRLAPDLPTLTPLTTFDAYIDAFALLIALEAAFFIILQRYDWFIQLIGFIALGLESTLPIPQLVTNHRRKSLAGFSPFVLFGWLLGDAFKSIYLVFLTPASNPLQFKLCALFQLSIDFVILGQAALYWRQTKLDSIKLYPDDSTNIHNLNDAV